MSSLNEKPKESEEKSGRKSRVGKRVTMAAVGRLAGVSQVTVSRALSDPDKVSPDTLDRIRHAIEVTGFVPNAIAGALASQRSRLVSALIPSLTNIVYASYITSFSNSMRDAGYQILLSETGFDASEEERLVETHVSRRPDAILLTGTRHTARSRRMLLSADIPVVEAWDLTDTPIDICVGFSHEDAARAVATFLAEKGYRHAATVTANDERALRRRDAFRQRFLESAEQVSRFDCEGPASISAGREALSRLHDDRWQKATCIFCSSDVLALGVMIEAQTRGLAIPDELAIIGFGDQEFAGDLSPPLTTVRVDRDTLGRRSADAIIRRISEDRCDGEALTEANERIDIGFDIIERSTTR